MLKPFLHVSSVSLMIHTSIYTLRTFFLADKNQPFRFHSALKAEAFNVADDIPAVPAYNEQNIINELFLEGNSYCSWCELALIFYIDRWQEALYEANRWSHHGSAHDEETHSM